MTADTEVKNNAGRTRTSLRTRLLLLVCLSALLPSLPFSLLLLGGLRSSMAGNMRKMMIHKASDFSIQVAESALIEDQAGVNRAIDALFTGEKELVFAAVYDENGAVLASRSRAGFPSAELPAAPGRLGQPSSRRVKTSFGDPLLDISTPIVYDGTYAGSVRMCLSMSGIGMEMRDKLLHVAGLIIIFLCLALLVSFRFARGITGPVGRLLSGIRKIRTEGDLSFRVETSSSDEIGELAEEFNRMAEDLNKTTVSRDALAREVEERRRAEAALLASRQYLADILDFLPDSVFVIDREGRVVLWNKAMEEATGMPAASMLGKGNEEYSYCLYGHRRSVLLDLVLKQDLSSETEYSCIRRRGKTLIAETFVPTVAGRGFFAMSKAAPLFDRSGNFMGAIEILRDVTEHKVQEDRIRDFTNGLIKLHMATEALASVQGAEALYRTACSRALDIAGLSVCALVGFGEEGRKLLQSSSGEESFAADLKALLEDAGGAEDCFPDRAEESRSPVVCQNLAAEPASDSVMRLAARHGFSSCLACPLSSRDAGPRVLLFFSRAVSHFTPDNLNLYSIWANQVGLALERVCLIDSLEQKVQARTSELSVQKQNAEEAMIQAESANRAKSAFLTNMSHELRTPLNIILVSGEVLEAQMFGPVNEKQGEYIRNIRASGKHLLSIINDILDLAKVEAGAMELRPSSLDVEEMLSAALSLFSEQSARKGIRLECKPRFGGRRSVMLADELKLKQILINLITNAIKFTGKGGIVSLEAEELDSDDGRLLRSGQAEALKAANPETRKYLLVSVRDTGIGIRPEDMGKLFKSFSQVDSSNTRSYEGTGLGLVLVRRLVELHGGRIWVESTFGEGSVFSFALPFRE